MGLLDRVTDGVGQISSSLGRGTLGKTESPRGKSVKIEQGRIINVDIKNYTVDVRTMMTYKTIENLQFMVPYCHPAQGEGFNFMPEVGSMCWLCIPSDNPDKGFIIGWGMPHESGAYRSGRELLNPGDLMLSSRDGNFIYVRRGGIVQIGATPVAQTVYLPIRNYIQNFCENYEVHTPAGDLTWNVMRQDEDLGGHKKTLFTLAAHEFADDPINKDPIALLKIGSHGDNSPTIVTLQTLDKGGGTTKTLLTIDKTGDVDWTIEKDLTLDVVNLIEMIKQNGVVHAGQNYNITAGAVVGLQAPQISLVAGGAAMALSATGAVFTGPAVALGDDGFAVVMQSPSFKKWVDAVTQALRGTGPGNPVMTVVLTPPDPYTSTKVKV